MFKLTKENKFLKAENEFIKNELIKLTGTYPVMDPNNPNQLEELTLKDGESLPPINSSIKNNRNQ